MSLSPTGMCTIWNLHVIGHIGRPCWLTWVFLHDVTRSVREVAIVLALFWAQSTGIVLGSVQIGMRYINYIFEQLRSCMFFYFWYLLWKNNFHFLTAEKREIYIFIYSLKSKFVDWCWMPQSLWQTDHTIPCHPSPPITTKSGCTSQSTIFAHTNLQLFDWWM